MWGYAINPAWLAKKLGEEINQYEPKLPWIAN